MFRWVTLFLALSLFLAACTGGPPKPITEQPQASQQPAPEQAPASQKPAPEQPPVAGQPPGEPIRSVTGLKEEPPGGLPALITVAQATDLKEVKIKPGEPVNLTGVGLFVMDLKSGAVEGWVAAEDASYTISPDNRWVTANVRAGTLLADRQSGAIYRIAPDQARLVAARGNTLLFMTAGHFWVTTTGMNGPFTVIALAPVDPLPKAAIARDGRTILLLNYTQLSQIETAAGKVKTLAEIEPPVKGSELFYTFLTPGPKGEGAVVTAGFHQAGREFTQILRYDAEGILLDNRSVPQGAFYSPDGKLVAWHETILGLTDAVVIGSANWEPQLRLRGEATSSIPLQGPYWLADSSGIAINTTRGPRLLRMDGTLESFAAAGEGWGVPVPAPDRTDLFAVDGLTVVDRAGNNIAAAARTGGTLGRLEPWGEQSGELRFVLHGGGKGVSGDPRVFAPVVDRAPFPTITGLTVKVAKDDCVNLRSGPSKEGAVITCLPDGTRLIAAEPPGINSKGELRKWGNPLPFDMGGYYLWYVRTEQGQRGYVFLSEEYLTFTVAKPGDPTADLVAYRVEDELINMRFWLGVAVGEVECGANCQSAGGTDALWGLKTWCETGPAAIRALPGFDATRHSSGLTSLENTCKDLTASAVNLNTPAGQEDWVKRAKELLAKLPQ